MKEGIESWPKKSTKLFLIKNIENNFKIKIKKTNTFLF